MMFAEFYRDDNDGWSDTAVEDHAEILAGVGARETRPGRRAYATSHHQRGDHAIAILEQRGFWAGHAIPVE